MSSAPAQSFVTGTSQVAQDIPAGQDLSRRPAHGSGSGGQFSPIRAEVAIDECIVEGRILRNLSGGFFTMGRTTTTCRQTGTNRGRAVLAALMLSVVSLPFAAVDAGEPANAARAELLEAARLTPDLAHGAQLFETCSACHGRDGLGTSDGSVPAIAGQHGSVILKQLVDFRREGRWDERMQHFTDRHHLQTPQDLTDVAAYVAKLPRFAPRYNAIGTGEYLQQGASVYFRVCEPCHRPLGQGDLLRFRPRLAGQHYQYLLKQLDDTAAGNRPAMDPAHVQRLRALTREERMGVADYLSRMSPDLSSDGSLKVSR